MKKEGRGEQQIGLANTNTNLDDPNFDRKLDLIIAGAKPFLKEHLLTRISKEKPRRKERSLNRLS
jgi:hypothetical protein